jgi:SAM-dependent methyltransferase
MKTFHKGEQAQNRAAALARVRRTRFLIDRVDAWIYDEISPYLGNRVLEVGCGLGNLLRHLSGRELVVGIDNDQDTASSLQMIYADVPNVQVHHADICEIEALSLGSLGFDTAVSLNVLEHIENDALALSHIKALLCQGGHLVVVVPAHAWLYGTMDRSLAHYRRYDKTAMAAKLDRLGFTLVKQMYMNPAGALGWFLNGRVLRRSLPPSGQLRMFNLLVPLLRAVERVAEPPLGLSLLTVARVSE